jgi:hypothetical protein
MTDVGDGMSAPHPISAIRDLKQEAALDTLRNLACYSETVMLIFAGRGAPAPVGRHKRLDIIQDFCRCPLISGQFLTG